MIKCFYFGVWNAGGAGHHLYSPDGQTRWRTGSDLPFDVKILDTLLLPPYGVQMEGLVHRARINGWTIVSFWDRSGDRRPGSVSAFVIFGDQTVDECLQAARAAFPNIFERFQFELINADNPRKDA